MFRSCRIRRFFGFHAFSAFDLYPKDQAGRPARTPSEAIRKLERLAKDGLNAEPDCLKTPLIEYSDAEIAKGRAWIAERSANPNARRIAIAPGCKTLANAWNADRFIELGRRIAARNNTEIIVIGGPAESQIGRLMIDDWKSGINAAGELSVSESGVVISLCDAFIGVDTGTTHLAAAVGTRCFGVFHERNNPGHWFPLGTGHTIVRHDVPCAGCRALVCPVEGHPCMNGITVEKVWPILESFLDRGDDDNGGEVEIIEV